MAVTGISFFYEEEKANVLKEAAKRDDRTTSSYLQKVLQDHIDKVEGSKSKPKKAKVIRRLKNA